MQKGKNLEFTIERWEQIKNGYPWGHTQNQRIAESIERLRGKLK